MPEGVYADDSNTATGYNALLLNTTGYSNTATGAWASYSNTTGSSNTATGSSALSNNTTGSGNTATGMAALIGNTTGVANTATGSWALQGNTTGAFNTATGNSALRNNATGKWNVAIGDETLKRNTTGTGNTAIGIIAVQENTEGSYNIGIGYKGGFNHTGKDSYNIDIANAGIRGESKTIRIGNTYQNQTFIAGISGKVSSSGNAVYINALGKLGTNKSSRLYKKDITSMGAASAVLIRLRPVTFRYKPEFYDGSKLLQYGLIAEEVKSVLPDLVSYNADGQIDTVRYQFLAPMLLNEFQRQQHVIENQAIEIAELKSQVAKLSDLFRQFESTR